MIRLNITNNIILFNYSELTDLLGEKHTTISFIGKEWLGT